MAPRKKNAAVNTTPAEVKETVAAEVKAPVEEKAPAKAAEKKPAAKKTAAKKPAAKAEKPAAKAEKPAAKAAAKKPAAEKKTGTRGGRKAKQVTIEDIVAKLYAKADKTKAAKIEGTIAVDVEVYGSLNGHLYIEVKDGVLSVEPYAYEDYTVRVAINAEDAVALVNGKLTLAAALEKSMYAEGNIGAALKVAAIL